MKPIARLVIAFSLIGLAACGNKGPLVLPTAPPADVPPPASPPAATPTPETLNQMEKATPPEGDGAEAGDAATPPGATPTPTP